MDASHVARIAKSAGDLVTGPIFGLFYSPRIEYYV